MNKEKLGEGRWVILGCLLILVVDLCACQSSAKAALERAKREGVENAIVCPDCNGSGSVECSSYSEVKRCYACRGSGFTLAGTECSVCEGSGVITEDHTNYARCNRCRGKGWLKPSSMRNFVIALTLVCDGKDLGC